MEKDLSNIIVDTLREYIQISNNMWVCVYTYIQGEQKTQTFITHHSFSSWVSLNIVYVLAS